MVDAAHRSPRMNQAYIRTPKPDGCLQDYRRVTWEAQRLREVTAMATLTTAGPAPTGPFRTVKPVPCATGDS